MPVYPKVTVEVPYDDVGTDEAVELMTQALVALGHSRKNVEEAYEEQDQD